MTIIIIIIIMHWSLRVSLINFVIHAHIYCYRLHAHVFNPELSCELLGTSVLLYSIDYNNNNNNSTMLYCECKAMHVYTYIYVLGSCTYSLI